MPHKIGCVCEECLVLVREMAAKLPGFQVPVIGVWTEESLAVLKEQLIAAAAREGKQLTKLEMDSTITEKCKQLGFTITLTGEIVDIEYKCYKCHTATDTAAIPPAKTICESCCEDHEYEYDAMERDKFCKHCNKRIPSDHYYDD